MRADECGGDTGHGRRREVGNKRDARDTPYPTSYPVPASAALEAGTEKRGVRKMSPKNIFSEMLFQIQLGLGLGLKPSPPFNHLKKYFF